MKFCIEKFMAGNLLREFQVQNFLWSEGLRTVDQAYPVIEIPRPTIRIPWVGEALIQESVVSKFVHECLDIEARKKIPNDPYES